MSSSQLLHLLLLLLPLQCCCNCTIYFSCILLLVSSVLLSKSGYKSIYHRYNQHKFDSSNSNNNKQNNNSNNDRSKNKNNINSNNQNNNGSTDNNNNNNNNNKNIDNNNNQRNNKKIGNNHSVNNNNQHFIVTKFENSDVFNIQKIEHCTKGVTVNSNHKSFNKDLLLGEEIVETRIHIISCKKFWQQQPIKEISNCSCHFIVQNRQNNSTSCKISNNFANTHTNNNNNNNNNNKNIINKNIINNNNNHATNNQLINNYSKCSYSRSSTEDAFNKLLTFGATILATFFCFFKQNSFESFSQSKRLKLDRSSSSRVHQNRRINCSTVQITPITKSATSLLSIALLVFTGSTFVLAF